MHHDPYPSSLTDGTRAKIRKLEGLPNKHQCQITVNASFSFQLCHTRGFISNNSGTPFYKYVVDKAFTFH